MSLSRVDRQPSWLLGRANARGQAIVRQAFAAEGLRPVHFRLLAALEEYGPLSQADLGRVLGLDRKDVAVELDVLTRKRLARRSPDPADARRNLVAPTRAGADLVPRLDRVLARAQADLLSPLTASERKTLVALLAKLDVAAEDGS